MATLPLTHRSKDQTPDPSAKSYVRVQPLQNNRPGILFRAEKGTRKILAVKKRNRTQTWGNKMLDNKGRHLPHGREQARENFRRRISRHYLIPDLAVPLP